MAAPKAAKCGAGWRGRTWASGDSTAIQLSAFDVTTQEHDMNRYKLAAIAAVLCVTVIALRGHGQQSPPPPGGAAPSNARDAMDGPGGGFSVMVPPPLTRVEALAAQKGVVIVK